MSVLGRGAWPYVVPYGLFLVLVELQKGFPSFAPVFFLARAVLPAALLLVFWRRGAYPELRGFRRDAGLIVDVLVGLAIAGTWVVPYLVWPGLLGEGPFDAAMFGQGIEPLAIGLRLLRFVLVTPFMEELFVRSFLVRYVDSLERSADFRSLPIARFTRRSFLVTVVWFTFSHSSWEWIVALPTGVALNVWLSRRGHLMACVVAHAVGNAIVFGLVLYAPESMPAFL